MNWEPRNGVSRRSWRRDVSDEVQEGLTQLHPALQCYLLPFLPILSVHQSPDYCVCYAPNESSILPGQLLFSEHNRMLELTVTSKNSQL